MVSYFDGSKWHITPWYYPTMDAEPKPGQTKFALAELLVRVDKILAGGKSAVGDPWSWASNVVAHPKMKAPGQNPWAN
jgi:hypothetical protein